MVFRQAEKLRTASRVVTVKGSPKFGVRRGVSCV
jgi:hypothetical protein